MAKKPKVERTFGLEIGMTETNQGKQVVIREADLFIVWRNDNGDVVLTEKNRVAGGRWLSEDRDATRFFDTGEWASQLEEKVL